MDVQTLSPRPDCDRRESRHVSSRAPAHAVWRDDEARFYADALITSDYVAKVGGVLRTLLGQPSSLLDVGAGSGILGRALIAPGGTWTAIEPNGYLADLLTDDPVRPPEQTIRDLWQNIGAYGDLSHETVLAANMGGPMDDAAAFVDAMLPFAKRFLCWTVPGQQGPRRYCLSGFLPPDLHGEDETPGHLIALHRLGAARAPDSVTFVDWMFRAVFADPTAAEAHLARQFELVDGDKRQALCAWLDEKLQPYEGGWAATASKTTVVLLWAK